MSQPLFTQGTWERSPYSSVVGSLISANGQNVAAVLPQVMQRRGDANADLIAAAPELLAALQAYYDLGLSDGNRCLFCEASVYGTHDTDDHSPDCEQEKAGNVIAKAIGK